VAAIALPAFVVIERRVRAPIVNFQFFRSRTFLGANVVAFLISFAMFAQFFFLTLYVQNILGYSPLQTGVRFLPATVVIIIMGPLAGRLTDRVGPRPLMTLGLIVVGAALAIQSRLTINSGYGLLLPGFVLMGLGMGLVMSPMSTSAMNSVNRTKAGAASGLLAMIRMVGSTFGVAVMGALVTTIGRSKIDSGLPHLAASTRARIADALGSGGTAGGHHAPAQVVSVVRGAFVSALGTGLTVSAVATLLGAAVAWKLIAPKVRRPAPAEAEAEAAAPEGEEAKSEVSLV
jgi:MFS family permease